MIQTPRRTRRGVTNLRVSGSSFANHVYLQHFHSRPPVLYCGRTLSPTLKAVHRRPFRGLCVRSRGQEGSRYPEPEDWGSSLSISCHFLRPCGAARCRALSGGRPVAGQGARGPPGGARGGWGSPCRERRAVVPRDREDCTVLYCLRSPAAPTSRAATRELPTMARFLASTAAVPARRHSQGVCKAAVKHSGARGHGRERAPNEPQQRTPDGRAIHARLVLRAAV